MTLLQALLLGLLQGLTEFLPVSSSGHLLFAHNFLGIDEYGLAFDVALHIGTLLALVIFFHKDIWQLARSLVSRSSTTRTTWLIVLATIPAVIAGMTLQDMAETSFRSPYLASVMLIVVAVLMLVAERFNRRREDTVDVETMTRNQAIVVGLAQAVALIPGVSRSGSTITAGLFAGLSRVAATRFSFLLSIPVTAGAVAKVMSDREVVTQIGQDAGVFAAGIAAAFVSGIIAIRFLLRFVAKHSLDIFAYYRIALGVLVLILLTVL